MGFGVTSTKIKYWYTELPNSSALPLYKNPALIHIDRSNIVFPFTIPAFCHVCFWFIWGVFLEIPLSRSLFPIAIFYLRLRSGSFFFFLQNLL